MLTTEKRTTVDGIGLLVGDLNAELLQYCQNCFAYTPCIATDLLNCHNHLYRVETIETEIVVKVRFSVELQNVSICVIEPL